MRSSAVYVQEQCPVRLSRKPDRTLLMTCLCGANHGSSSISSGTLNFSVADMREPNEIDFWRGFALVTIFINHVPGLYFERFTHRNVSLSDSAELFVFLAGWALRKLVDSAPRDVSAAWLVLRLESRAFDVYVAQIVITEIAIAILAAASIFLDAPFLLDWHNASAVFNDPVRTHIGIVALTHQLGYFNILPLYVILMICAPLIALIHRSASLSLLPASLAIYASALTLGINLPTWPVEGTWFFNPLTWQVIFVLGFLAAGTNGLGGFVRRYREPLRWLALPVVALGAMAALTRFSPDPVDVPSPALVFMFSKTFLSPARLLHALALALLFGGAYASIRRFVPKLSDYLSLLGRNSLRVFCAGSILSLAGQVLRFALGGTFAIDAVIVSVGISILGTVAWASEWRERFRKVSAKRQPPSSSVASS